MIVVELAGCPHCDNPVTAALSNDQYAWEIEHTDSIRASRGVILHQALLDCTPPMQAYLFDSMVAGVIRKVHPEMLDKT